MTEQEWLACTDPMPILDFSRGKASDRKLRLFAVAGCRRIWQALTDQRSRHAVEVSERHADGQASQMGLYMAQLRAKVAVPNRPPLTLAATAGRAARIAYGAARAAWLTVFRPDYARDVAVATAMVAQRQLPAGCAGSNKWQCKLLRDIFGNPFRPVVLDPAWLAWHDGTIPKLAQAIYDERAFDRLPILADALEEGGCDNADILAHCRGPGPHVRGCWVVDLILAKQ